MERAAHGRRVRGMSVDVKGLAVFDDAPLQIFRHGPFFLLVDAAFEKKLLIESAHRKRQEAAELAKDEFNSPPAVKNIRCDHFYQTEHVVEQKTHSAVEITIVEAERLLPGLRHLARVNPERHL